MKNDPLAGRREAINAGLAESLMWDDDGQGCPVQVGELFRLRSCQIEITRIHRVTKLGGWRWRAEFKRIYPDRVHMLGRRGGYTDDLDLAMRAQDDPQAATIDPISRDDRSQEHRDLGEPPEPEGVAPHEVAELPSSIEAQDRYRQLHNDEIEKRIDRSLTSKLREVRIRARSVGVDVSEEMELIQDATERARRKVAKAA